MTWHVIDTHTAFSKAKFIIDKSLVALWNLFIDIWTTVYLGYPSTIRLDREASFDSSAFRNLADNAGVILQFSGVECHNAIGVGEMYHALLRRIYLSVGNQHPKTSQDLALRLSIKTLNDKMGPHGLVSSLLVFSALSTCPAPLQHKPIQIDRFKLLKSARREMEAYVYEQRIRTALTSKLLPATRFHLTPGQEVRLYRE